MSNDWKKIRPNVVYKITKSNNPKFVNKEFTIEEFRGQPVPQIPWSTIIKIIKKSKSHEEMLWYINETNGGKNERFIK